MDFPEEVLQEGRLILNLIFPDFNFDPVTLAFRKTVSLYQGECPKYQSCNTDAGYIQKDRDTEGTGAKYTVLHVQRSMDFLERHGAEFGLSHEEIAEGRVMILCTDLAVDISAIEFPSSEVELLGKMLGTTDLLAQMADRTYLEKLLFLYHEFREARVGDYESEVDLLRKTVGFYDFMAHRLEKTLDAADRFMASHFAARWNIHQNLYHKAIEKQKNYLIKILEIQDADPRRFLKRNSIVEQVHEKYPEKV